MLWLYVKHVSHSLQSQQPETAGNDSKMFAQAHTMRYQLLMSSVHETLGNQIMLRGSETTSETWCVQRELQMALFRHS